MLMWDTALAVGGYQNIWLAKALFVVGVLLLLAWAIPFFWQEAVGERYELRLDRMLSRYPPLSFSVEPDGRVSGNADVTGRVWFQSPVVLDDVYVLFWQRRWPWLPFKRFTPVKAPLAGASAESMGRPRTEPFNGMRLAPGDQLKFNKSLFVTLFDRPDRSPSPHGAFYADLYVSLLVPHRIVHLRLGDEVTQPSTPNTSAGQR